MRRIILIACLIVVLGSVFGTAVGVAETAPPPGTVSSNGGLKFSHQLAKENFSGLKPKHGKAANFRPGRIVVETDPARVRSGKSSIRFQIQPGDCGRSAGPGSWDDCKLRNERIEVTTQGSTAKSSFYAFSVLLSRDFSALQNYHPEVNLYQNYQYGSGACFNIQYSIPRKALHIQHRCVNGRYDHGSPKNTYVPGPTFDRWHEFVIYAKWSRGSDGVYRVLHNGKLVYSFSGATLAADAGSKIITNLFIYRYEGVGRTTTASTAWFDDIVASKSFSKISARYPVSKAALGVR
ncbi:polysaccharide lyase-like protein [Aliiruegeria haliotis]|uniref:Polysaccharide lyase-like protein n=1 Tax=Aliiruegeria haliotis TaxID=1280846 RepID=A0A2T0RUG4_9RHOB|nr:polysaccharide lyase-like protein [Aliiruegeria haliotis]